MESARSEKQNNTRKNARTLRVFYLLFLLYPMERNSSILSSFFIFTLPTVNLYILVIFQFAQVIHYFCLL